MTGAMIRVELMTRAGCHLCDEMKVSLERAAEGLEVELVETDIDGDAALAAEFGHDIPVLFVNGSRAFKHRATVQELRTRLLLERLTGREERR